MDKIRIKYKDQVKKPAGLASFVSGLALLASRLASSASGLVLSASGMASFVSGLASLTHTLSTWADDKASPLADKASPLTDEAPSFGPYFFLFFFLNYLLCVNRDSNAIRIIAKNCLFQDPMLIY